MSRADHICMSSSDHMALAVTLQHSQPIQVTRSRRFHFEEVWTTKPKCEEVIRGAWAVHHVGSPMYVLCQKIKQARVALLQWS